MKRIALAAACMGVALFTCAAGSALAAPEFFNNGEAVPAGKKIAFTSKGTASKWEMGIVLECAGSAGKGDVEGSHEIVKMKITFSSCNAPSITSSCQKAPTKPGVIVTELLQAPLALASEAKSGPVSVVAKIESENPEKPVMKFTCGPHEEITFVVTGELLAEIDPVNAAESTKDSLIDREKAKEEGFGCTKQQYLFVEGIGPCIHLETGAGLMWLIAEEELTYAKAIEVHN